MGVVTTSISRFLSLIARAEVPVRTWSPPLSRARLTPPPIARWSQSGGAPPGKRRRSACRQIVLVTGVPSARGARQGGQILPEVVVPLGQSPKRCCRVRDHAQRTVLGMRAPTEQVGGPRNVWTTFLPHAPLRRVPGAVEGIEDRVRRRVDAADTGIRITWVEDVPLARHLDIESRVRRLVARDVGFEAHRREVRPADGGRTREEERCGMEKLVGGGVADRTW